MTRALGPRLPPNGLILYREDDDGNEIPILVLYDYEPAQKAVRWGDYPEPGHDETAMLDPPRGIVLTADETDYLIAEAIAREQEGALAWLDDRDDARRAA